MVQVLAVIPHAHRGPLTLPCWAGLAAQQKVFSVFLSIDFFLKKIRFEKNPITKTFKVEKVQI
jgi:hypothetical protein